MPELIARSEAKSRGLTKFYTGKPCKRGHDSERYTVSGACLVCNAKKAPERAAPVPAVVKPTAGFLIFAGWTEANRALLIDTWIDTGDIATARDAIGVSPSAYQREVEQNSAFAKAVAEAKPKAEKHLEERLIQLALRGNDKALIATVKARFAEYRDSSKVDVNINQTVRHKSDDELDRRIRQLGGGAIIDASFTEIGPQEPNRAVGLIGRASAPAEPEQAVDDVPAAWADDPLLA